MHPPTPPSRYFAASNSRHGFRNYYPAIFHISPSSPPPVSPVPRHGEAVYITHPQGGISSAPQGGILPAHLYIIKGGPGTGKSHFMKTVARYARERGYAVTEYLCSSDPASLDGLLLTHPQKPSLGFIDGTAPHTAEPTSPGVREEIINLGAFWKADCLATAGDTVARLSAEKSAAYARAYACLAAAGEVDDVADSLITPAIREDRLAALAARLLRDAPADKAPFVTPALRRAVGMSGRTTLHTFENKAATVVAIEDSYGLGARLMSHLYALSCQQGHTMCLSIDPVYDGKLDGLFYPGCGLTILCGDCEAPADTSVRPLRLRRYLDPEALRPIRGEWRHLAALRAELEEEALRHLSAAAKAHFALETIYAAAMDFGAKEAYTERFLEGVMSK